MGLLPTLSFSFLIFFIFKNTIISHYNYNQWVSAARHVLPEIFLLHGTIISDENTGIFNSCTWYISVLLICEYFFWLLLSYYKKTDRFDIFVQVLPVVSLVIYTYMYYTLGTTNNWRTHVFEIINYGELRSIAGLSAGIFIYYYSSYKKVAQNQLKSSLLRIVGGIMLSLPFVLCFFSYKRASFIYVLMFVVGLYCLAVSEHIEIKEEIFRLVLFNAKVSYGMFLNHYLVSFFFIYCLNVKFSFVGILSYILFLYFYSIITLFILNRFVKIIKNESN